MNRALTWSFGGGTQSVAIACLVADGRLPRPDVIVMADTGYEASETWEYLDRYVRPLLDVEVVPPTAYQTTDGLQAKNGSVLMPVFTAGGAGQLPNYCTNEWKVRPVRRFLRDRGFGPEAPIRTWIGISIDELHRAKPSGVEWQEYHYPLLFDVPMRRDECRALVERFGLPSPPKSSCYFWQ